MANRLAESGVAVRAVLRRQPSALVSGVDWRSADLTDSEAACDAAKGAVVVYQCLNTPYTQWPRRFLPLQRAVLAAAERADALLMTLENVYGYGPMDGKSLTEKLPLAATTSKGGLLTSDQHNRIAQAWNTVARYPDYAGAQAAVDRLSKDGFPVEEFSIVGSDLSPRCCWVPASAWR